MKDQANYTFTYAFISTHPDSNEARLQERLEGWLLNQTGLVDHLLGGYDESNEFSWNDVVNGYEPCEQCASCMEESDHGRPCTVEICDNPAFREVYSWYAFAADELDIAHLKKAGWTYLDNTFGTWVARYDAGQSWKLDFLPALLNALYNTELDDEDIRALAA